MAALNAVRAVRKKIGKISAERMGTGGRVSQKKKKNWARKRKKFCPNRGTASLSGPPATTQPLPAPARMAGVCRAGYRGAVVRFWGGLASSPPPIAPIARCFFSRIACIAEPLHQPTNPHPAKWGDLGRRGAVWRGNGANGWATPTNPPQMAEKGCQHCQHWADSPPTHSTTHPSALKWGV